MVSEKIGQKLHRQVEIGPLHVGLRGLGIDEVKISEIPDAKAGPFIDARGVRIGWSLRSLWKGLDLKNKFVTQSNGSFHIDDFRNPHYMAKDMALQWSLTDMDPTWSHLNGWATLDQAEGKLENIDQLLNQSKSAKVILTPVFALMNLDRLGILGLGLPDLRHWPIQDIKGNYTFKNGKMSINRFMIDSPTIRLGTTGTVDLANGPLALDVSLNIPKTSVSGELDAKLKVSGTSAHPKVDLSTLKKQAFRATVNKVLDDPRVKEGIDKTLNNLFH